MGDLGYVGMPHCLMPFKKNALHAREAIARSRFNAQDVPRSCRPQKRPQDIPEWKKDFLAGEFDSCGPCFNSWLSPIANTRGA